MADSPPADCEPPSPELSDYAYSLKISAEEHRREQKQVRLAECNQKWKGVSNQEKKRFRDLAAEDTVRYHREQADYRRRVGLPALVPPPAATKEDQHP